MCLNQSSMCRVFSNCTSLFYKLGRCHIFTKKLLYVHYLSLNQIKLFSKVFPMTIEIYVISIKSIILSQLNIMHLKRFVLTLIFFNMVTYIILVFGHFEWTL